MNKINAKRYTVGEEIFSAVVHGVGAMLGIVALVTMLVRSAKSGDVYAIVASAVFGASLIILYTMSTLYHALTNPTAKKVFRIFDHATIFLLIAGTYTPILTISLAPKYPLAAWLTFTAVWGLAVLEIVMNAIDLKKFEKLSLIAYVAIGWAIIFSIDKAYNALGGAGFAFLLSGGVVYTIGAVLYAIGKHKKLKYVHSVFHFFVLAGSVLQAICILFYVL